ncbi:alanine racemase [Pseudomonas putida]|uniref:alanine racemase n=1 Tax=Pseudomonas sp. X4 TaxID=3231526 RepID=UPI003460933A|nr:alanine racemase [Pseudomonas putida]
MNVLTRTLLSVAVSLAFNQALQAAPLLTADSTGPITIKSISASNAWIEVNKTAFESNLQTLQKKLDGKSQICAVMKADAYGHGIALLVPSVIAMKVPCIAVASNEEAKVVREKGFDGRLIRVRTATLPEIENALQYDMEELVSGADFAQKSGEIALKHGKILKVHVALNSSGMSRNGLEMKTENGKAQALKLVKQDGLQVVGIMTHFAVEDREDVLKGLASFKDESQWLIDNAKLDRSKLTLHAAASFATQNVPEAWLDMVRPGNLIYGDPVANSEEFKRVMSFKSSVASINKYPAGNTVGYDRTITLKRDSILANIPVGYSDGYRRAFTNKAYVLINGQRVPTVGKVSMNTLMVDVTDLQGSAKPGDEVVLFGKQGSAEITQAELEDFNGALLADLYTVWGNSNPKILTED